MALRLGLLLQWTLWQSAALGAVFVLYNRWLIQWVDGPVKTAAMATVGLACTMGAGWAALCAGQIIQKLPALIVLGFSMGEVRRVWFRHTYHAPSSVVADTSRVRLLHPVTTTDLVVSRYQVPAHLAPSRIRILQLTDLHFTPKLPVAYFDQVRETARKEAPDIIVLTGDYVSRIEYLPLMSRWLRDFPKAPYGTYAVLGNHDYWAKADEFVRAMFVEHGIQWMAGRCERIAAATSRHLVVCGTEEPWGPGAQPDAFDPDDYVIMLTHTPDNVYATQTQVDLMFAGHSHGGQLRIPWVGSLVVPSRYGRRLDRGTFHIERTQLFVSSGIGVDSPSLRLYCPPEIIVVDLV
jgi:predicted MPP superfamily phosphohydrolase